MNPKVSLHIAIDTHHLEGSRTGVGRYLENILRRLIGNTPHRFTLYFKDALSDDGFLFKPGVKASVLPKVLGGASTALFQHVALPKALQYDQPDVFWGPGYVLPAFIKTPSVLTIHDIIYEARPDWYSWPSLADRFLLRYLGRQSARHARQILVPSTFTKTEIMSHYGLPASRLKVTPLAADERFKPSQSRDSQLFIQWRLGPNYILFVGALINRLCIAELWSAFEKVAASRPDLQLVLVGPDYTSPVLKIPERVKALSPGQPWSRYIYKPFADTSTLCQLYSFARATVALSLYEGFGLPPLEAMACGSPVVASNTASHPEVVGRAAVLVNNPRNPAEIASALEKVLDNPDLASRLSRAGLKQARQFSWAQTARGTLEVLEAVGYSKK